MQNIVIDGTFIQSAYQGIMLCASVIDTVGESL